jgi:lipopolysaccharide cholinephosphotransferase
MNQEMNQSASSLQEHQDALLRLLVEFDRVCRRLNVPYMLFAGTMLGAVRHQGFIPWDDDLDVIMLRKDYERFLAEADSLLNTNDFYLQKEFSPNWPMFFSKLRLNGTTCLEKYHPKHPDCHQGIYIDIFPCDNALASGFGRKLQFYASKVVIAKSLWRRGYETDSGKKKLFMTLCRLLPIKPFLKLVRMGKGNSEWVHGFLCAGKAYDKNVFPRRYFTETKEMRFAGGEYPVSVWSHELLSQLYGDYMQLPPPEERVWKQHALLVDVHHSYEQYKDYRKGMDFEVHTKSIR